MRTSTTNLLSMARLRCSRPRQCGLDRSPRCRGIDFKLQEEVFEVQLQLAQELQRPV